VAAEVLYYAAHLEGTFPTATAALDHVQVPQADRDHWILRATINQSPDTLIPCNADYGVVLHTLDDGTVQLWRAFYGMAEPDREAAESLIAEFEAEGVTGTWAIFEWTAPISTASN
jgi:hypothetical protein